MKEKAIFNWSGGKDSALCLYKVLQTRQYEILCLLTSVNEKFQRISMHGVRVELLEAQAKNIGLPLIKIEIPETPTMESYEKQMFSALTALKNKGAAASIFGDILLEDLRAYREKKLAELNLKGVFPLWNQPTDKLIRKFIDLGFKTIVTCVNEKFLDKSFAGRVIDSDFLNDLPDNVDACGENGEFHTFVFDAPFFGRPIPIEKGEIIYQKYTDKTNNSLDTGFWYCDLLLSE